MPPSEVYEVEDETVVEIEVLSGKRYQGEFSLLLGKSSGKRDPQMDRVKIDNAVEMPNGKKINGAVEVWAKDIKNSKFVYNA